VYTLGPDEHEVIEAEDGYRALAVLRERPADVAILDVAMPGINGLSFARVARRGPELDDIGIIILSANTSAEEACAAGADRFLSKPFSPLALLDAIAELAALSHSVT
jgi:CheY-like chemotaxis protein